MAFNVQNTLTQNPSTDYFAFGKQSTGALLVNDAGRPSNSSSSSFLTTTTIPSSFRSSIASRASTLWSAVSSVVSTPATTPATTPAPSIRGSRSSCKLPKTLKLLQFYKSFSDSPNNVQQKILDDPTMPAPPKINVLALDGGGVRGLSEILILIEIQERLVKAGKPDERITDHFHLIGGTSTGGCVVPCSSSVEWNLYSTSISTQTYSTDAHQAQTDSPRTTLRVHWSL